MDSIFANIFDALIQFILDCSGCTLEQLTINKDDVLMIKDLWETVSLFGIAMSIFYFCIEINKVWAFEGNSMSLKSFAAPFLKLVFAIALISESLDIFVAVTGWGNGFIAAADSWEIVEANETFIFDSEAMINGLNFWGKIIMIFPLIAGLLVAMVCQLVFIYKGFVFKVEFIVRFGFAPVACADIYSGQNSTTIRYLKGLMALVLYGACLIIVPKITMGIAISDLVNNAFTVTDGVAVLKEANIDNIFVTLLDVLKIVIAPIAAIGITGAAKQITKEALGA